MKKYTYLLKNVFFRRIIIVATSIILFFMFNMLLFTLSRSFIATGEGLNYFEGVTNEDVMIANLDPETSFDVLNAIDEENLAPLVDYMDDNLDYGVQFQGIPNGVEFNGIPLQYNLYDELTYTYQNISISEGRNFQSSDFQNHDTTPVIIGWSLGQAQPVGSTFTSLNPFTLERETYQVVGILKQNAFVPNYYMLDSKNYLNHTIVSPMPSKGLGNLDKAFIIEGLFNTFVESADSEEIATFQDLLLEQTDIKLNFYSQKENVADFMRDYQNTISQIAIVLAVVLLSMVILLVWHIYSSIKMMMKEITLHMLARLNYRDLRIALYIFHGVLFTASTVASFVFALARRMKIASMHAADFAVVTNLGLLPMDWYGLLLVLLVNVVISIVIVQIIMWRIKKIPFSIGVLS